MDYKTFKGIFFLGSNYDPKILNDIKESKKDDVFVRTDDESAREKVNEIVFNSARRFIKGNILESKLFLKDEKHSVFIDYVSFDSQEDKDNKNINTVYIVTQSTKLKISATVRTLYITKMLTRFGYTFNNIGILLITPGHKGDFREIDFTISHSFMLKKGKVAPGEAYSINLNDFFIDGIINDEPASRSDYIREQRKRNKAFEKISDEFWGTIEKYEKGISFSSLSTDEVGVELFTNDMILKDSDIDFSKAGKSGKDTLVSKTMLERVRVYLDVETLNFPFPVFNNSAQYAQYPIQYSVIVTDNENNIIESHDEVFDFNDKSLGALWTYTREMVSQIYQEDAAYIAHNKSFEDRTLKNLLGIFDDSYVAYEEVEFRIQEITSPFNRIDTEKPFRKDITFEAFPGKYSIKYINKWVDINRKDLVEKYDVKSYETDLDVSNGLEAQNKLAKLYFGLYDPKVADKVIDQLKEYCHNDVVAMLPLIDLIDEGK